MCSVAISIDRLSFAYGSRQALDEVTLSVQPGEIFGLLGPNGGGKTTLFRILSTLLPVQSGHAEILGVDVARSPSTVRRLIGVTFQSPSLDPRLTVLENLRHQSHLYGISGSEMRKRIDQVVTRFGLADRRRQLAETLSGGYQRRVEIAKGLLHEPRVLLLDEPGTGLDPGARLDVWNYLRQLQAESGMTVLVTTHLMEEADKCDRLAILDAGGVVACGTPAELRSSVGGDCLSIHAAQPADLSSRIEAEFDIVPQTVGEVLRIEHKEGHVLLRSLVDRFPNEIESVSLGKPTLEDVFIARTGHRFEPEAAS